MRRLLCLLTSLTLCLLGGVWIGGKLTTEAPPAAKPAAQAPKPKPQAPPPVTPLQPPASREAFAEWANQQSSAGHAEAVAAAFTRRNIEDQTELVFHLLNEGGNMNTALVGRLIRSLPPGDAREKSLERLLGHWISEDALDALHYLETLPPEWLRSPSLIYIVGFGLCQLPAQQVIAFANARLDDLSRGHLREVLAVMLDQAGSFENTMAMLEGIPAEPDRSSLGDFSLSSNFAAVVPDQVRQWIDTETNPIRRDQFLSGYTRMVENEDPAAALALDARMTDAETRRQEQHRHLMRWLKSDRAAALTWLRSAPADVLDAETRDRWLRHYTP